MGHGALKAGPPKKAPCPILRRLFVEGWESMNPPQPSNPNCEPSFEPPSVKLSPIVRSQFSLHMRRFLLIFALVRRARRRCCPRRPPSSYADVAHLHVQLVLPQSTLYPGGPNSAGLYFKLEPGWHVYWQNAGDSGEPPRIHWTLPDGVTASAAPVSRARSVCRSVR